MQTVTAPSAQEGRLSVRRPLRWLLRMNDPVPVRSDEEIEAEVWKNYRWNFTVNVVDGAFFWLGLSFASASTILPLFVSKLSDNPLLIGLIAMLAQAGWYLPQLLSAGAIERTARKKPWVVNLGFFTERLPVMIWPLAALLALVSPTAALVLFFLTYALHQFGAGIIAPAWQDLVAACFPVNRRGRFMGMNSFLGTATGAAGAILSGRILEQTGFPYNFAVLFGLAAACVFVSWIFIALTREPVRAVDAETMQDRDVWGKLGRILRQDQRFRRFFIVRLLITLSSMGVGFVTVAAIAHFDLPDRTVGYFTVALMAGQTAGNLFMGFLADRYGHKLSLELGTLAAVLAFAMAWWAPAAIWFYAVFFLLGISLATTILSGLMIVMEYADRNKRPTYAGIANTGVGIISMIGPMLGGWIALLGYSWLFALCTGIGLIGLALLRFWVVDPRHQTA
jgi:MFS family permease